MPIYKGSVKLEKYCEHDFTIEADSEEDALDEARDEALDDFDECPIEEEYTVEKIEDDEEDDEEEVNDE